MHAALTLYSGGADSAIGPRPPKELDTWRVEFYPDDPESVRAAGDELKKRLFEVVRMAIRLRARELYRAGIRDERHAELIELADKMALDEAHADEITGRRYFIAAATGTDLATYMGAGDGAGTNQEVA